MIDKILDFLKKRWKWILRVIIGLLVLLITVGFVWYWTTKNPEEEEKEKAQISDSQKNTGSDKATSVSQEQINAILNELRNEKAAREKLTAVIDEILKQQKVPKAEVEPPKVEVKTAKAEAAVETAKTETPSVEAEKAVKTPEDEWETKWKDSTETKNLRKILKTLR